ncbi:MAG: indole-3-glycerol phosphate synthase TrpC [Lachnospiraceae bacterium]
MILDQIVKSTIERIEKKKKIIPLEELKKEVDLLKITMDFPFEKALRSDGMSFICEIKKASPSKGIIAEDFPYIEIAKEYEKAGATAISCLTEPFYFKGSDTFLEEIRKEVSIPILRKDFVIDPYMIYEAKLMGANAILLICSILDEFTLRKYVFLAKSLGLSVLVETHTKEEVEKALYCGANIIGVNNRDLKTFHVDLNKSIELREFVSEEYIFISESGIHTKEDIALLHKYRVDGVLIGESLMKSENKKDLLREWKGI